MRTAIALLVAVVTFGCGQVAAEVATQSSPSGDNSASPVTPPSPSANLPAFACNSVTGGGANSGPDVVDVRVASASGYDRFVIQFDGPVPEYTVTPQGSSSFWEDASGRIFQLQGSAGLRIVVRNSSSYDVNGVQTYSGPNDFQPGSPLLKEARNMGDFERVYTWGLGLGAPNCFRAYTLTGPDRLVVDVQST